MHESLCAQEPSMCAQEKHSVDIHPHARIHAIQSIRIKSFTAYLSLYKKCVYRMQSVLILPASCHTCTHVAKHCADNPCCACLRSLCAFVFEKHHTSHKSALYQRPAISANESCIFAQEPCISELKKRRADTHID